MKKIKSKIFTGVASLFIVILILSILGIVFINQLAQSSRGSIKDNYRSVDYTMQMQKDIDGIYEHLIQKPNNISKSDTTQGGDVRINIFISDFEKNLSLEQHNITEIGEAELAAELNQNFKAFLSSVIRIQKENYVPSSSNLSELKTYYDQSKENIFDIYKLNINAILRRNSEAESTAEHITIYMAVVASISILLTLFFVFSFPGKIVSPITELTNKIKAISDRDYEQKLNISSNDEMGELARAFNVMVQRLKEYEETNLDKILFEKKRIDAIVQNLQDAVLILDENKKIIIINNSTLKLTGLKEEDVLNKYAPDVAARNDLIRTMISNVMSSDGSAQQDIQPIKIAVDGKEEYFSIENIVVDIKSSNKKNNLFGYICMLKNITRFQERDTAKTNLIATVSHELKTPLSSINLSLKLLDDKRLGQLNSEQREVINSLRQQSTRLSRVINELLDFSQIETGNIKLKFSSVKPDVIVDIGTTSLMMQLSEKHIDLQTNIDDGLPEIRADVEKLVFVFINILNNAIRYSKSGDVITIDVKRAGGEVEYSIIDNGPGISKEDQEKLFQRFMQVGNKAKQGWGLGLAISKEFMQAQDGKLRVESEIGKGSKFIFAVPFVSDKKSLPKN